MKIIRILLMIIIFSFFPKFVGISISNDDPFKGPWGKNTKTTSEIQKRTINPLKHLVGFYKDYISPIDGSRCPMYPSCSQYSIECFEKHGLIAGWLMTCDRLLHEADEMKQTPMILINNRFGFYDPVENNDFWWYEEK
jgi:putative component of membrane protein insertase Oxa1/YidC/SpoIIIJ protein YidD